MNMNWTRRMLVLLGLMVMLVAGVQAQGVLPPPQEGIDVKGPTPQPLLVDIPASSGLFWESIGAVKYTVKVKNPETGFSFKWTTKATESCPEDLMHCAYLFPDHKAVRNQLFAGFRNNDQAVVRVIAKYADGIKIPSAWKVMRMVEAYPANLYAPNDNVLLATIPTFKWVTILGNDSKHTLVVVDTHTNKKVVNMKKIAPCPDAMCTVSNVSGDFMPGRTYNWYIITKGPTGEKAKSDIWTFTLANV